MATIRDIARLTGHSISTVSRAINHSGYVAPETKAKIMAAVKKLDYRPNHIARELSSGRTHRIGLILPYANHPFFHRLVNSISAAALSAGYEVVLLPTNYNRHVEVDRLEELRAHAFDGLIFTSRSNSFDFIMQYADYGPIVCCENTRHYPLSCAYKNRENSFQKTFQRLKAKGYRKIGVTVSRNEYVSASAQATIRAYQRVFGLPLKDELLFRDALTPFDSATAAGEFLAAEPGLEAILANSDEIAAGVYQYCQHHQRQLTLIGQDNELISQLLNFSTIDNRLNDIGSIAFSLLFEKEVKKVLVPATFIERHLPSLHQA